MRWLILLLSLLLFGATLADNMEGANPAAEQNEYTQQAAAASTENVRMSEEKKSSEAEALKEFFNDDKYKNLQKYKVKAVFKVPGGS